MCLAIGRNTGRFTFRGVDKRHTLRVALLEFWPDYGAGPLWAEGGKVVDLASLGLPRELIEELVIWNRGYAEEKLPLEGSGDEAWLREGERLLRRTRAALGRGVSVVVTEPWWGERPE